MKLKIRKLLCLMLCIGIMAACLSACSGQQPEPAEAETTVIEQQETEPATETEPAAETEPAPLAGVQEADELQAFLSQAIQQEKPDSVELLVVGGGETFCSVIPINLWRDYGYTAYLFGTDLRMVTPEDPALIQILDVQHPKTLVMETAAFFRASDQPDPLAEETAAYTQFFRRNLSCTFREPGKGYVVKSETRPAEHIPIMEASFASIPESNLRSLRALVSECGSRGIQMVFYTVPNLATWNADRHDAVQLLADEFGIPYLDANLAEGSVDWSEDSWNAGAHLNYEGAKKNTEVLGSFLQGLDCLEDRRGMQEYSFWDDYCADFEEMARKFTEY